MFIHAKRAWPEAVAQNLRDHELSVFIRIARIWSKLLQYEVFRADAEGTYSNNNAADEKVWHSENSWFPFQRLRTLNWNHNETTSKLNIPTQRHL